MDIKEYTKAEIKWVFSLGKGSYRLIAEEMYKQFNIKTTGQNLANKVSRGTLKATELFMICKILGLKINIDKD
jgi:hypothetical protein